MSFVSEANTVFTVLTLLANVAFVALVLVGIVALLGGRSFGRKVVTVLGPRAPLLALVVAAVATAGSLYYSEIVDYIPCELCWYQRICMYPLVPILAVGVWRRDPSVRLYAAAFVLVGAPVSLYHWLVERVPSLADSVACSATTPCSVPYFEELGFVTLAWMALSGFLLIGLLLLTARAYERTPIGQAGET
jgi:disulfide bond formation protein DsbB